MLPPIYPQNNNAYIYVSANYTFSLFAATPTARVPTARVLMCEHFQESPQVFMTPDP